MNQSRCHRSDPRNSQSSHSLTLANDPTPRQTNLLINSESNRQSLISTTVLDHSKNVLAVLGGESGVDVVAEVLIPLTERRNATDSLDLLDMVEILAQESDIIEVRASGSVAIADLLEAVSDGAAKLSVVTGGVDGNDLQNLGVSYCQRTAAVLHVSELQREDIVRRVVSAATGLSGKGNCAGTKGLPHGRST
jgi:hypothetical protein